MNALKVFRFLLKTKDHHFLSVDGDFYRRWRRVIILIIRFNPNYQSVEIYRKKFKNLTNFVVVGLKYTGKNVKRRTSGFAKSYVIRNRKSKCFYCETKLTEENATADHIIPISEGGNNSQVNLVVCCKSCNNERGNEKFNKFLQYKNKKKLKDFI